LGGDRGLAAVATVYYLESGWRSQDQPGPTETNKHQLRKLYPSDAYIIDAVEKELITLDAYMYYKHYH
jgi:hypothetical protein